MLLKKILIAVFSVLMFLPVAFFTPTMCYYAFNKEAVNNETTTTTTVVDSPNYQTNVVNSANDLKIGNVYRISYNSAITFDLSFNYSDVWIISGRFEATSISWIGNKVISTDVNSLMIYGYQNQVFASSDTVKSLDFVYNGSYWQSSSRPFSTDIITSCPVTYSKGISTTTTTVVEKDNDIVGSINQALEDTFELPIFNWATDNDTHAVLETVGSYMDIDGDNAVLSLLNYWLCVGGLFLVVYAVCLLPMYTLGFMDR